MLESHLGQSCNALPLKYTITAMTSRYWHWQLLCACVQPLPEWQLGDDQVHMCPLTVAHI